MRRSVRVGNDSPAAKIPAKGQVWSSIVSCTLVEARNLLPTDPTRNASAPEPYIKFKLGTEKFKCKVRGLYSWSFLLRLARMMIVLQPGKGLEPKWRERFDLYIYDENNQTLDVTVHDKRKNFFMGR